MAVRRYRRLRRSRRPSAPMAKCGRCKFTLDLRVHSCMRGCVYHDGEIHLFCEACAAAPLAERPSKRVAQREVLPWYEGEALKRKRAACRA